MLLISHARMVDSFYAPALLRLRTLLTIVVVCGGV